MEEEASRHMGRFVHELDHAQAYIENENYNELLYNYIGEKFAYTVRD